MSLAVFRAMLLGALRDRGALVMGFALPAAVFLLLAMIFAGASGQELRLKVAFADELETDLSRRLIEALRQDPSLEPVGRTGGEADRVRELVKSGAADVGLIVREGARELSDLTGFGPAPLVVVMDPVRGVAAPMLVGQIQRAYFEALPDVALAGVVDLLENQFLELDDLQREDLAQGLADVRDESVAALDAGQPTGWGFQELSETEAVAGVSGRVHHVAYYAGAVAVMFVLFASVNGAVSLLQERDSGLVDRILAGPGSPGVLIDGKFLFLTLQGFVQIAVIFVTAWLVYRIDVPRYLAQWSIITLATGAAASGFGLVVATAFRTTRQAQTFATVAILLVSAIGGSMVPRFLMPPFLQDLGWITPNTWAIEAYASVFWRGEGWSRLPLPLGILSGMAILGLLVARGLARRRATG